MRLKAALLGAVSIFFIGFGVLMLATSYHQQNLGVFLALFFSSSLIILISVVCLIGAAIRLIKPIQPPAVEEEVE